MLKFEINATMRHEHLQGKYLTIHEQDIAMFICHTFVAAIFIKYLVKYQENRERYR